MKQRIIAFILLLVGIIAGISLLFYFFYFRVGAVVINMQNFEEVGAYDVEIYAKATTITSSKTCIDNPCVLEDMPAGEYTFTISADKYKDIVFSSSLAAGESFEVVQKLEKNTTLRLVEAPVASQEIKTPEEIKAEKIAYLREKKLYDDILETPYSEKLYTYTSVGTSVVKYGDSEVMRLKDDEKFQDIKVMKNVNGEDYIFSLPTRFIWLSGDFMYSKEFKFALPIIYFKDGIDSQKILVTEKGSFDIKPMQGDLDYFVMFHDYVVVDDGLIGLAKSNDEQRKHNLGIDSSGEVLIHYNRTTKQKNIVYTTKDNIEKIYKKNNSIYVEILDSKGGVLTYEVINL